MGAPSSPDPPPLPPPPQPEPDEAADEAARSRRRRELARTGASQLRIDPPVAPGSGGGTGIRLPD